MVGIDIAENSQVSLAIKALEFFFPKVKIVFVLAAFGYLFYGHVNRVRTPGFEILRINLGFESYMPFKRVDTVLAHPADVYFGFLLY